jgi:hypothetical protein
MLNRRMVQRHARDEFSCRRVEESPGPAMKTAMILLRWSALAALLGIAGCAAYPAGPGYASGYYAAPAYPGWYGYGGLGIIGWGGYPYAARWHHGWHPHWHHGFDHAHFAAGHHGFGHPHFAHGGPHPNFRHSHG